MRPTESHLPQASLDMLVLQAVAAGSTHGFGVMQRLRQLSGEVFRVSAATLYPTLHKLESGGLLAAGRKRDAGRYVKLYRLTRAGRAKLKDDAGWKLLSDAVGQFTAAAPQHDDMTAMVVSYRPPSA